MRLITDLGDPELLRAASQPVAYFQRDFDAETPVSDEVFDVFRGVFAYDDTPLGAVVEQTDTVQPAIVRERIVMDAAYGDESLVVYLFHSVDEPARPRQTVVYFPGSGYINNPQLEIQVDIPAALRQRIGLIVRSGRTTAFPVYDGMLERADDFVYTLQDETNAYRDRVIEWYQDLGRAVGAMWSACSGI